MAPAGKIMALISSILRECLKIARQTRGRSARNLAELMDISPTQVTRAEKGDRPIKGEFLDQVCESLQMSADEFFAPLMKPSEDSGVQDVAELIEQSSSVELFHPFFIPLHLQRPEYSRGVYIDVTSSIRPDHFEPDAFVEKKQKMAETLRKKVKRSIVSESALLNVVGSPSTMLDQLKHLEQRIDSFRVYPIRAPIGTVENTMIFDRSIAMAETFIDTIVTREHHLVEYACQTFDYLWKLSVSGEKAQYILRKSIDHHSKLIGPGWKLKLIESET